MSDNQQPWTASWTVKREIARGGQGVVSELFSTNPEEKRAVLKEIVPRWREDQQARLRLQNEAETLRRLYDLGAKVPEVYDSFETHGSSEPFIVMEFIPGLRFDEWLKQRAPVDPQKAVIITRALGRTVSLSHEHNIGHRDIKPSNIILRDGEINSPYIIDFGISFDSQQTMILTREGEMFWNEFIILPECQDLQGGHRDLRSDITALVGLFFSCLTGRPPIVLRDAEERAPHQRHESLLFKVATSVEQGERLMWFFDKGFAFRISDRFQTMDEFMGQLARFADTSSTEPLDLFTQFDVLNQTVQSTDRNVQVGELRVVYNTMAHKIAEAVQREMNAIKDHGGAYSLMQRRVDQMSDADKPSIKGGDLLREMVQAYRVSREHFGRSAVVLLVAFGIGMQIHLYAASYTAPVADINQNEKPLTWTKIAVVEEGNGALNETKLAVIVDALKAKLAHEIRSLARPQEPQ
jgi:serine/threonine protein kinase